MARRRGRRRDRGRHEGAIERRDQHERREDRRPGLDARSRHEAHEAPGALAAFYDDHQAVTLGVTAVAAGAAGMTLNARLGPVTPLDLQPSTVAALGCGLVALAAHRRKAHRAKRLALAATIGMVGATAHARAKAGGLLSNARVDDVSGDVSGAGEDEGDEGEANRGHGRSGAPPV